MDGVVFKYEKDILENGHRIKEPWIVNQVSAMLNDEQVGYLKISYIPKKKYKKYWSDIWAFAENELGCCWLKEFKTTKQRYEYLSDHWLCGKGYTTNKEKLKSITRWISQHEKQYRYLISYLVDKPLVDFIRVREDLQRKGIGRSLYVQGAQELAKDGFVLYASGLQSESAKACWEYMELHDFPVKRENGRKFLDYR